MVKTELLARPQPQQTAKGQEVSPFGGDGKAKFGGRNLPRPASLPKSAQHGSTFVARKGVPKSREVEAGASNDQFAGTMIGGLVNGNIKIGAGAVKGSN